MAMLKLFNIQKWTLFTSTSRIVSGVLVWWSPSFIRSVDYSGFVSIFEKEESIKESVLRVDTLLIMDENATIFTVSKTIGSTLLHSQVSLEDSNSTSQHLCICLATIWHQASAHPPFRGGCHHCGNI
jgi:hypothetical protein